MERRSSTGEETDGGRREGEDREEERRTGDGGRREDDGSPRVRSRGVDYSSLLSKHEPETTTAEQLNLHIHLMRVSVRAHVRLVAGADSESSCLLCLF